VSVSAGEDFEVVNPNADNIATYAFYQPQAGEFEEQAGDLSSADEDLTQQESKPVDVAVETSIGVKDGSTNAYKIFWRPCGFSAASYETLCLSSYFGSFFN
jgi:hypothetical protein